MGASEDLLPPLLVSKVVNGVVLVEAPPGGGGNLLIPQLQKRGLNDTRFRGLGKLAMIRGQWRFHRRIARYSALSAGGSRSERLKLKQGSKRLSKSTPSISVSRKPSHNTRDRKGIE